MKISSTTRSTTPDDHRRRVFLGLGANIGNPRQQLLDALAALSRRLGPLRVAPLYHTAPVSPIPQATFLNTVVEVLTDSSPGDLLELAKSLEHRAGRHPGPRLGPRPLDIDLLLVGTLTMTTPGLTLPHPGLRERGFVLAPLAHLAPDLALPPDGATATDLLSRLPKGGRQRVRWAAGC